MDSNHIDKFILFTKDCGSYQSNVGARCNELNKIKTRISDMIFNYSLFKAKLQQNDIDENGNLHDLIEYILDKEENNIENLKLLEEELGQVLNLLSDDTNSAKYTTRAIMNDLEKQKEGVM